MMDKMKNLVVGLTGQTGAGKTTVSDYLKENGVTIIDADHRLIRAAAYHEQSLDDPKQERYDG